MEESAALAVPGLLYIFPEGISFFSRAPACFEMTFQVVILELADTQPGTAGTAAVAWAAEVTFMRG